MDPHLEGGADDQQAADAAEETRNTTTSSPAPVAPSAEEGAHSDGSTSTTDAAVDGPCTADAAIPEESVEGAEEGTNDEGATDVQVAVVTVDGPKGVERRALTEFAANAALRDVEGHLAACQAAGEKPPRFALCSITFPHNILTCSALHLQGEVLRIGKFETVRIRGLVRNPGLERLLTEPSARHVICSSAKVHSALTCKNLHRDPRTVVVGRECHFYLPEEFVDNQALRHLLSHPEHTGRWCTNPQKHEPKTCQFLHRAPPIGMMIGRRNQNLTKDGKVAVSSRPIFDKKKTVNGRIARDVDIPEAIRQQQAELLLAVDAAQSSAADAAAESSCTESDTGSTQDASSLLNSGSPTLFGVHPAIALVVISIILAFFIPVLFPE